MEKVRGKRSEVGGRKTVDNLRAEINRLHAERGAAVATARNSRISGGFKSAAFQLDWKHVEDLTEHIAAAEAELAERGGAEDAERVTLLRDPEAELPKHESINARQNVVVVRANRYVSVAVHAVDRTWIETDGNLIDDVTGWCGFNEAVKALKAATREVRS